MLKVDQQQKIASLVSTIETVIKGKREIIKQVLTSLFVGLEETASNWARFGQNVFYRTTWGLGEKLFQLTLTSWRSIRPVQIFRVLFLLLLCGALLGGAFRFIRGKKRNKVADPIGQMATAIQLYTALLSLLRSLGRPKLEYLTPNEFAATFAREAIGRQVRAITTIYNMLRFGLEPSSQEQIEHAYQLLDEIKASKRTMHTSR